jgi:hypothetical protein
MLWSECSLARRRNFYNACQGPAWELLLPEAGHFQLLDEQSLLQRAVCAVGPVDDAAVRNIAQVPDSPSDAVYFAC